MLLLHGLLLTGCGTKPAVDSEKLYKRSGEGLKNHATKTKIYQQNTNPVSKKK